MNEAPMSKHAASELPLKGLNVVELHAIGPVPFAGLQLQQLGASIIRVSPPGNRAIGIDLLPEADLLNRGKQVCEINLKTPAGHARLLQLLANADVLTEGYRPGVLERFDLSPESLSRQFPRLVIGRLSGFGRRGAYAPRAGHDINYLGLSGALAAIGTSEEPIIPLNLVADFGGGAMHLLTGILARLVQRSISGKGGLVDTSILAGTLGLTSMTHGLLAGGRWTLLRQNNLLDGGAPFYRVYKTLDEKFVAVGALENVFFGHLLKLTGLDDTISQEHQYDEHTWPAMSAAFEDRFSRQSRDYWENAAEHSDCCVTPVLDFEESLRHPHNLANGWIVDEPFPHPGPVLYFQTSTT